MFLLNFVGCLVRVMLFWFAPRWLGTLRWLVNLLMMIYVASTFAAWLEFGRPNPMGLGYLWKGIEIGMAVAIVVHLSFVLQDRLSDSDKMATSVTVRRLRRWRLADR